MLDHSGRGVFPRRGSAANAALYALGVFNVKVLLSFSATQSSRPLSHGHCPCTHARACQFHELDSFRNIARPFKPVSQLHF
jgi:hypothetical protein